MGRWLNRTFTSFTIDDQLFERVAETAHARTNGSIAFLTTWRTTCPECQTPFTFDHPTRPAPAYPTRRCKGCQRPGETVRTASSAQRTHSKANVRSLPRPRQKPVVDVLTMDAPPLATAVTRHEGMHAWGSMDVDPEAALRRLHEQAVAASPEPAEPATRPPGKPIMFTDR